MKLSELKKELKDLNELVFVLPNGELIPEHFHITEVGQIDKKFIDCGGVIRTEKVVNLQLWYADDQDHRLTSQKLISILELSETKLNIEDLEIEVEYQGSTIEKYGLELHDKKLRLQAKQTNCLAEDQCGIPEKKKIRLSELQNNNSCCSPGTTCC